MKNKKKAVKKKQRQSLFLFVCIFFGLVIFYCNLLDWLFLKSRFPHEGWDFIIPVISVLIAYFNFQKFKAAKEKFKPDFRGVYLIVGAVALQAAGLKFAFIATQLLSFIAMISGLLIYFGGKQFWAYFSFPLFFLLLKLPWGYYLISTFGTYGICSFQAKLVALFSSWVGISSTADGIRVIADNTTSRIVAHCSGWYTVDAKYLIGALFVYYSKGDFKTKLWKYLMIFPLITIINFIRIWTLHLSWNVFVPYGYDPKQIHVISNHMHKAVLIGSLYWLSLGFRFKKD